MDPFNEMMKAFDEQEAYAKRRNRKLGNIIDWVAWNEIRDQVEQSLCRGEESLLTDEQIKIVNDRIKTASNAIAEVTTFFEIAKQKFASK